MSTLRSCNIEELDEVFDTGVGGLGKVGDGVGGDEEIAGRD